MRPYGGTERICFKYSITKFYKHKGMKKKRTSVFSDSMGWKRFYPIRQLKLILIVIGCLQFSMVAHAKNEQYLTLKMDNASLEELIWEIQKKSDFVFMYVTKEIAHVQHLKVDEQKKTVSEILDKYLNDTGLTYAISGNAIVIKVRSTEKKPKTLALKGFVQDVKKRPMPGVTVHLAGTMVGTSTDSRGWFHLTLPVDNGQLEFSFVGFKKEVLNFTAQTAKDTLRVAMKEDVQAMDEVVVTGYGNVSKGNYTRASTTVQARDVMMAGVSTIDQMLQGVVPGMLVMNGTGMVGATPKVRVRGTSTLLGSQEPVWVVDGVIQRDPQPFNSADNFKFSVDADDIKQLAGNAISWLNPNDIETITVLKDASATAIYGSQAANGVIVITTKKATAGKIQVSYSGDFSIGQRPHYGLYDLMNSAERMELSKNIYEERRTFPSGTLLLPIGYEGLLAKYLNKKITVEEMNVEYQKMAKENTDWFDLLFRNSFNHSHNLSINGGSNNIQNRTSFGFGQDRGEAKGNDMTRFTVSSNTMIKLFDCLVVNMLLNGSVREVNGFAYGVDPFGYAYNTSRAIPAYNEDGSFYFHEKEGGNSPVIAGKRIYNYNILNEKKNTGSESRTRNWGATLDLKWNILPCLEYQGVFAYSSSSSDSKQYATEQSFYITQHRGYEYDYFAPSANEISWSPLPRGGILSTGLTNVQTIMARNSLVYHSTYRDKHQVTIQLGVETNSVKTKGETNVRYGYLPERGETFAKPPVTYYSPSWGSKQDNSVFAQGSHTVVNRIDNQFSTYGMAVYSYDNRYVVNFNGRYDASNRFGQDKNKRFQPTWSAGAKWRIANESFWRDRWWFNNLDLYGSYGYQGNAVSSVSPYLIARYTYVSMFDNHGLQIVSTPYPDLGWEKTKTWNIGLTAAFLENRLNFTFNYFKKKSEVLSSRAIPYENGVGEGIVFGSTMGNKGYDFVINVTPVRTKSLTWQLSLNTSITRNSIEKNERVNYLNEYLNGSCFVDGRPFSTFYSHIFSGLDSRYGQPEFKNMDKKSVENVTDILVESGKFTPDFSGGLNTMVKYRNISLYALFAIQWGGHRRLPNLYDTGLTVLGGLPRPEQNASKKLINRWKRPGDKSQIPSLPGTGYDRINYPIVTSIGESNIRNNRYAMYNQSNVRVANTDFIRCRQLSLSYDFEGEWKEKIGIRHMSVKASMSNPFMWVSDKKWDGLDPETGNWPARRITSLSLHVIF